MRVYTRRPMAERFWEKVQPSSTGDCWLWTGTKNPDGYGAFGVSTGYSRRANRVAFDLAHPKTPLLPGEQSCHHCDTPLCVNPAHLFRGSRRDNMQDASRKGRLRCKHPVTHCKHGHEFTEENTKMRTDPRNGCRYRACIACKRTWDRRGPRGNAKLQLDEVREIRRRGASGETTTKLAVAYGVTRNAIYGILRGVTWRHVA